jgi:hypothetical protein
MQTYVVTWREAGGIYGWGLTRAAKIATASKRADRMWRVHGAHTAVGEITCSAAVYDREITARYDDAPHYCYESLPR